MEASDSVLENMSLGFPGIRVDVKARKQMGALHVCLVAH